MSIQVKYLASLADELKKTSDTLNTTDSLKIIDIWERLNPEMPIKSNIICSVNFEYANKDTIVSDGSEVAFLPPVTGG